jgi:hypothetical protein
MEQGNSDSGIISLTELTKDNLPEEFAISTYFDTAARPSVFQDLFNREGVLSVLDLLVQLEDYLKERLDEKKGGVSSMEELPPPENTIVAGNVRVFAEGPVDFFPAVLTGPRSGEGYLFLGGNTRIIGSSFSTEAGHIAIGEGSTLGPGSMITGPSWIGSRNEIRPGSYFRENVMTGNDCIFRCEAKHSVFLDEVQFPHPSYVGDSILGYKSHFGNQATTANITLANAIRAEEEWKSIVVNIGPLRVDTGMSKLGIIMGDHCQVGCGTVFDPGVFLGHSTWVYPLSLVGSGFYGPSVVIKNSPARAGVQKVVPRR